DLFCEEQRFKDVADSVGHADNVARYRVRSDIPPRVSNNLENLQHMQLIRFGLPVDRTQRTRVRELARKQLDLLRLFQRIICPAIWKHLCPLQKLDRKSTRLN